MTKKNYELDFEEIHIKLLIDLIPFFGNTINEVIRNISLRWIENNIFKSSYSEMKKEIDRITR
ncbi:MAG: hypothetical protein LN408_03270 [Candidatus Thermoplasmatota archaeon]|nr:hypothetical protein [Candidatus Thermoplasmatota archaeon]